MNQGYSDRDVLFSHYLSCFSLKSITVIFPPALEIDEPLGWMRARGVLF